MALESFSRRAKSGKYFTIRNRVLFFDLYVQVVVLYSRLQPE